MAKRPVDRNAVLDFLTRVQGEANIVADLLSEAMSGQDAALLAMLQEKLRPIRAVILRNENPLASWKEVTSRLEAIHTQITDIMHRGVQKSAAILYEKAELVAGQTRRYTAQEIEAILADEKSVRNRFLKKELTDEDIKEKIQNMLNYKPFVDGKTIQQWFGNMKYDISSKIFQRVQKGVIEGYTLHDIILSIRGKPDKDGVFHGGILQATRKSAEILARTTINAVANQSRLEMYREHSDVIDGVKWLAALDHRTCMICGAYDGKVWKSDKLDEVKVPPAHPNCRCVLVPYIDIGEGGTRPAEAENFDLMAREKYEENHTKSWDELSYEYRRQLRYKAIKDYKESGKEPYKQLSSGAKFDDYLRGQPDDFARQWLGRTRFELFKAGKLDLKQMVKPDSGFRYALDDLKEKYGVDISPHEQRTRDYFAKSDETAQIYNEEEIEAIQHYSNPAWATNINGKLRNDVALEPDDQKQVAVLRSAIEKFAVDQDIVVYRGVDDYKKVFDGLPKEGMEREWDGFVSTTINRYIADDYSKYTKDSVVIELVVPKGTHGIMMGTEKLSKTHRKDKEFLLTDKTLVKVISVEKKNNGYYVKANVVKRKTPHS